MMNVFEKLKAPFSPKQVSWRVGATNGDKSKGLALAYIDARDVMERLDSVLGPENWQNRYSHAAGKTVCDIGVKVGDEWIWKADGAGDTDTEAEKGALSDAFKRTAVRWGVGRYLYDLGNVWVELKQQGKSYAIADHERPKLERVLAGQDQPPASTPRPALKTVTGAPATPKAQSREPFEKIQSGIRKIGAEGTHEDLSRWFNTHAATIEGFEASWHDTIMSKFTEARADITARLGPKPDKKGEAA